MPHSWGAGRCFVLADERTHRAAGEAVCAALDNSRIPYTEYVLPGNTVKPDEKTVGAAVMHFDRRCDLVIGVGSGVINDVGKLLSKTAGTPYIIVGTAPSMDGYASATSSMDVDGLKVSLPSRCADAVVGDPPFPQADVFCQHIPQPGNQHPFRRLPL